MALRVPDTARDPKTPADVRVSMEPRVPDSDPTLGIPVYAAKPGLPRNRLVVIGDSLAQGFQSGAISDTQLSFPAIIAWEMGWDDSFRRPTYEGFGGLPINIEYVIRDLESRFGERIDWWEAPGAVLALRNLMAKVEEWWERGPGSQIPPATGIMHNLSVYGWDLRDALSRDAANIQARLTEDPKSFLRVDHANERAALRVYDSARDARGNPLKAFQAAAALGAQGAVQADGTEFPDADGIETLIILLGSNNALGSVVRLKVRWSQDGYDDLHLKSAFTVWRPTHFAAEFARVVALVKEIRARHVIIGNVPHVTIAPIARGVHGKVRQGSRYFPWYTRPWIRDADFRPTEDPCITEQEARAVDSAIDQYNDTIAGTVREARQQGLDWYVLDVAAILDRLASRRYILDVAARPAWWKRYELPPELDALQPPLDSRFFGSGPSGRTQGGLFSLDGVHPTTIAYGILAQEFIQVMERAGVVFYLGDGVTPRRAPVRVDFSRLLWLDTLIKDPPRSWDANLKLLGWIDEALDFVRRLSPFG